MAGSGKIGKVSWNRYGYKFAGIDREYKRVSTIKNMLGKGDGLILWAAGAVAAKSASYAAAFAQGRMTSEELCVALNDPDLGRAHEEVREKAADFGTVFHGFAESIAKGDADALDVVEREIDEAALRQFATASGLKEPSDLDLRLFEQRLDPAQRTQLGDLRAELHARLWPDAEAFLDWHDRERPTWIRNEAVVFNDTLGYAGQADALIEIGGCRLILDHKTSKSVYGEFGLQLAAYRFAEWMATEDGDTRETMPETDGGVILHIRDGKCRLLELPCGADVFERFQGLVHLYWWDRDQPKKGYPEWCRPLPGLNDAPAPQVDLCGVLA